MKKIEVSYPKLGAKIKLELSIYLSKEIDTNDLIFSFSRICELLEIESSQKKMDSIDLRLCPSLWITKTFVVSDESATMLQLMFNSIKSNLTDFYKLGERNGKDLLTGLANGNYTLKDFE